jgi:2-hydroxychromene-2-carboxylate isomerase
MHYFKGVKALWYFDFVSPYSYLHLKQFGHIARPLEVEPVPVLFAGLLKAHENKGPAEIAPKRLHTYRQVVWSAHQLGIELRFPPRHPFNPLPYLRLAVARGPTLQGVEAIFDLLWMEGRDPDDPATLHAAANALGLPEALPHIAAPEVKARLAANTEAAAAAGVFGVPTMQVGAERFWGSDSIPMMNAYLHDPGLFARGQMARIADLPFGATRKT